MQATPVKQAAFVCSAAFVLLAAYALSRPAIESWFLASHGSRMLPLAWGVVTIVMTAVVLVYNRLSRSTGLAALLMRAALLSAGVLAALLVWVKTSDSRSGVFALYVWKDVYVVVLLELLWSFANVVFSIRTARWFYGFFLLCGSSGGILGNLAAGALAMRFGTQQTVWAVLPLLLLLAALCTAVPEPEARPREAKATPALRETVALLRSSRYLGWMMALVGTVQIAIVLIDYQFNLVLEQSVPDVDERTAIFGYVYAAVDIASAVLQVLSGVVLRFVGVGITLLGVPLVLAGFVSAFAVFPTVPIIAALKTASKAFDYSLFKAAKEILYIPLSYAEKTRGKAVVDMFTYRTAKGVASLLMLALGAVSAAGLVPFVLAVIVVWVVVTTRIVYTWRLSRGRGNDDA